MRWNPEPPAWSIDLGTFGELSYGSDYYQLQPGEAMNAANLTTRRSIFVELGGFNPGTSGNTIIVGDLEVGLCRKLMAAGWKLVYVPGALVYHLQDGSRVTLERMRFRHTQQTRFIAYQDDKLHRQSIFGLSYHVARQVAKATVFGILAQYYRLRGSSAAYRAKRVMKWSSRSGSILRPYDRLSGISRLDTPRRLVQSSS